MKKLLLGLFVSSSCFAGPACFVRFQEIGTEWVKDKIYKPELCEAFKLGQELDFQIMDMAKDTVETKRVLVTAKLVRDYEKR